MLEIRGWLRKPENRTKTLNGMKWTGHIIKEFCVTFARGLKRIYTGYKSVSGKESKFSQLGKRMDRATKSKEWKAMGKAMGGGDPFEGNPFGENPFGEDSKENQKKKARPKRKRQPRTKKTTQKYAIIDGKAYPLA